MEGLAVLPGVPETIAMKILPVRLGVSTAYLLACKEGYLQVDTGYAHDYPLYRRRLATLGIDIGEIRTLFLTHHHDDHAGFLNELARAAPVRIIAHREAAVLLQKGQNDLTHGGGYMNHTVHRLASLKAKLDKRWTLRFPPFALRKEDILLGGDDETLLPGLGIPGRILYTPGHCIDHLSLVLEDGRAFFGDAASSFLLAMGTAYCAVFMTDMEATYGSWARLLRAGARVIYPTHGRPFPAKRLTQNMGRYKTAELVKFF
jgi:glyoxylase-like metal-dependent hydrolase (beta-lactamase superfamily II)